MDIIKQSRVLDCLPNAGCKSIIEEVGLIIILQIRDCISFILDAFVSFLVFKTDW